MSENERAARGVTHTYAPGHDMLRLCATCRRPEHEHAVSEVEVVGSVEAPRLSIDQIDSAETFSLTGWVLA